MEELELQPNKAPDPDQMKAELYKMIDKCEIK